VMTLSSTGTPGVLIRPEVDRSRAAGAREGPGRVKEILPEC
jgi:hypothetical protein